MNATSVDDFQGRGEGDGQFGERDNTLLASLTVHSASHPPSMSAALCGPCALHVMGPEYY